MGYDVWSMTYRLLPNSKVVKDGAAQLSENLDVACLETSMRVDRKACRNA
jgi:hypothetical protein